MPELFCTTLKKCTALQSSGFDGMQTVRGGRSNRLTLKLDVLLFLHHAIKEIIYTYRTILGLAQTVNRNISTEEMLRSCKKTSYPIKQRNIYAY